MTLNGKQIISVTPGGVLYRDELEVVHWVDFKECSRNWLKTRPNPTEGDRRRVGLRDTNGKSIDVEFFTEPRIRFVFADQAERAELLIAPMRKYGWYTWDEN